MLFHCVAGRRRAAGAAKPCCRAAACLKQGPRSDSTDTKRRETTDHRQRQRRCCGSVRSERYFCQIAVAVSFLTSDQLREAQDSDSWEDGGEDWPAAGARCLVGVPRLLAQKVGGAGLPNLHWPTLRPAGGRDSFNRSSRFVEAAGRRLVWALISAYFDDSHI